MKLCRYNADRLGLVSNEQVIDVTDALRAIPEARRPPPPGDRLIANLAAVAAEARAMRKAGFVQRHASVRLLSPVANPVKVIGAPANYTAHHAEAQGLFQKTSAPVGPSDGVALRFPDRRNDHGVGLAMVIGRECKNVARDDALEVVAGYTIGLDVTLRGKEDRSLRKAVDSYAVLGPWLVTADEIPDPDRLDLSLAVNGEERQRSNTSRQVFDCRRLIAYAARFYTLYPGDVVMTGTPEGAGPVAPGDVMRCEIESIGAMEVAVRAA